ncbi:hypothetical protein O0I10_001321 [Lichtheimia ornata]|uniref:Uncharacterized protein n=1 Tax=Lichtheimia ornata TaxID=688661 RepID=A0AAD7Y3J2_9FUNG|nr:uncharacterized protein O0I10_001321 [Lichtheimia ornata]KAJ8663144.1 hypothetical protein O0I10_001321 [Lichtheimia ornata]
MHEKHLTSSILFSKHSGNSLDEVDIVIRQCQSPENTYSNNSNTKPMMRTSATTAVDSLRRHWYSDFCSECGVDVFRFCHEHWCKNFQ